MGYREENEKLKIEIEKLKSKLQNQKPEIENGNSEIEIQELKSKNKAQGFKIQELELENNKLKVQISECHKEYQALCSEMKPELEEHLFSDETDEESTEISVMDKQEGGNHYKKGIQPWEYIEANDMDYWDGNVLKYLTRHKLKNGAEDIRKAIHYLEKVLDRYSKGKYSKKLG